MHAVSRVLVLAGLTSSIPSLLTTCRREDVHTYTHTALVVQCIHTLKLYPWFTKNLCRFVEKCISSVS